MASFLYKPNSSGQVNPGGTSVIIGDPSVTSVDVFDDKGTKLDTLSRGALENGQQKFFSSKPGSSYGSKATVRVTGANGKTTDYNIGDTSQRHEGDFADPSSVQAVPGGKGSEGSFSGDPRFTPGNIGLGNYPANLDKEFPTPFLTKYKNIKSAPFNFTDPFKFAEQYGEFNRGEVLKNFDMSKDLALKELDTELQGMQKFVPAASALKRSETSIDNQFNQAQRTQQVDQALPGARQDLLGQESRANAYASGRLPSSVEDRAYELGIRSGAADTASAGGFGVRSSVARKASDLLSAEQRLNLSKYGDQLLTQNVGTRSNLELAPTEYSNAGAEVRVMPEVGAGRLTSQNLTEANNLTVLPTATAFSSQIQQNEFKTQLEQGTRQFNASNTLQNSQFNAQNQNQFALTKFQYDVGYAGTVAGAAQTNTNAQLALQMQQQYQDIFSQFQHKAQDAQQIHDIVSTITGAITAGISLFKGSGATTTPNNQSVSGGSSSSVPSVGQQVTSDNGTGYPSGVDIGGPADSVAVPPNNPIPDGFSGVATGADGSTIAVPDVPSNDFQTQAASADTGLNFRSSSPQKSAALVSQGGAVLKSAGISSTPGPGMQPAGVDNSGKPVYTQTALARSTDTSAGTQSVNTLKQVLSPLGVFNDKQDSEKIDSIANAAQDASVIAGLTDSALRGDSKGFVNGILNAVKQPTIEALTKDPQNQAGLNSAFSAYQIYSNWGSMSPAQKSLAIAHLGISGYKFATNENLASKFIIKDPSVPGGGLTVGQGLGLFQAGVNTYSLVKNWNQLNTLQKVAAGTGDAAQIANLAQQFKLLGSGTSGAAVAGVTSESLASAGFTQAASQYGVGAMTGATNATVPAGYTAIASEGGEQIIVPTANLGSAQGAVGSYLPQVAGAASVALGAYQVYQGWGGSGGKGALNGALGGSAMAAGLYTLGATNPYLLAAVVATSILADATGGGKSGNQKQRDQVRSAFQSNGLADKDFNVTLADGSKFNIGVDGHGQQRSVAHPEFSTVKDKDIKTVNAWDTDYTNDLDYAAGIGGIALSRLVNGGKETHIDQVGSQLGNAALSTVGYGKEFSQSNFSTTMANLRSMYAQSGIKSKADGYQLANQAYAEHRLDETDLASTHHALDIVFDNNYGKAQSLMAGRMRGVEVAGQLKPDQVETPSNSIKKPPMTGAPSSSVVGSTPNQKPIYQTVSAPEAAVATGIKGLAKVGPRPASSTFNLSKEEIRRRNQERYQRQAA